MKDSIFLKQFIPWSMGTASFIPSCEEFRFTENISRALYNYISKIQIIRTSCELFSEEGNGCIRGTWTHELTTYFQNPGHSPACTVYIIYISLYIWTQYVEYHHKNIAVFVMIFNILIAMLIFFSYYSIKI